MRFISAVRSRVRHLVANWRADRSSGAVTADMRARGLAMELSRNMPAKSFTGGQTFTPQQLGKPVTKEWTAEEGIQDGFKSTHWVYACVMKIARSASSVPWIVETRNGKGIWERATDHELEMIVEYPNPFMSRADVIERETTHLYLAGNGILDKVRGGGMVVAELWPVSPDLVTPVPDKIKYIAYYQYKIGNDKIQVKPEDVIHFQFPDPSNALWGMSPMQAAADLVACEVEAVNWWRNSISNRTVPDGMIKFKEVLTRKQYEAAKAAIDEQRAGPDKARQMLVVGADAEYTRFSLTPAEMDYMESRGMTRIDICAVLGVPPPMVGIYDNATLANLNTSRTIFWKDTVIPFLDDLRNHLNISLAPEYGVDATKRRPLFRLNYDLSEVEALQEDLAKKVETAKVLWSIGLPFAAINRRLEIGMEDGLEGADVGFVPANVLPIAEAGATDGGGGSGGAGMGKSSGGGELGGGGIIGGIGERDAKALGVAGEARKTAYWKAFDRRRRAFERQMSTRLKVLFSRQSEAAMMAVSRAPAGYESRDAEAVVDADAETWARAFLTSWREVASDFGRAVAHDLGGKSLGAENIDVKDERWDFDPWPEEADRAARTFVARKIDQVSNTTKAKVRRVIAESLEEGLSTPQIAGEIELLYSGFSRYRSHVIARTEIVGASNFGSREAMKQSRLDPDREWLSSRDERVRKTHAPGSGVDGERVKGVDTKYSNDCLFPGDPGGPAEEVIQCRCVETYHA